MKYLLTLILFFNIFNSFSQTDTSIQNIEYKRNDFIFQYPENWRLDTSRIMGTELFIFSPLENKSDKFSENINVIIQDLKGQNINLEKYKQITDKQLDDLDNSKVFESSIIRTDNKEYYEAIYTMTQGQLKLKITSVCFITNEKAYLITFTSEIQKYDKYKKTSDEILNSFWFY